MKNLFHKLTHIGVHPGLHPDMTDEVKVINSIKVHGAIMVWTVGLITIAMMPEHAAFMLVLLCIHLAAAILSISLNGLRQYAIAKWIFIFDPALLVISLTAYFGLELNFQYIGLICFLMFLILFRKTTDQNFWLLTAYLLLLVSSVLFVYLYDIQLVQLSVDEVDAFRVSVFTLSIALTVMMGLVLQRNSKIRSVRNAETLKVSERDASILQTISDNMEEAIFKSSVNCGLVYVNSAFARMYGYSSKEEMLQVPPIGLYASKSDRDELIARLLKQGNVTNVLMTYRKKDGSTFYGRLSSSVVVENGETFLLGTIADVTIQQNQTALLQQNERQLKEAQRLAKLGNWRIYPNENRVDWSGECAHIHGFLPMDFENSLEVWFQAIQDIAPEEIVNSIERSALMNKAFEFGSWYRTPSGEQKYLFYIAQQEHHNENVVWFGTVQDQTEIKQQELELRSTRSFYQNVLDNIPVEVVLLDESLRFQYVSKNAIMNDELRHWLIGKTNMDYVEYRGLDTQIALKRDEMCRQALAENITVRWEEQLKTKDGRDTYHLRNIATTNLMERGEVKRYVLGYSFDINDIKRAQFRLEDRNEELNQLNKELDRFVYSISHDLRAPIASVLGLNSLAEESEDQEELNNILMMQREALDRLDLYIRDVIDYSRNKRLDVRAEEVVVKKVLDECMADLVYMANYDDIEYFVEVDEDLRWHTDALRFKIILNNLLSNAIKYADPGKKNSFISIRAFISDGDFHLEIADNGIGIKSEYKDLIWDIFFRGTSTIPGSGLGLYILRESVKNIGGEVRFTSKEGEGTTFFVTLPSIKKGLED